MKPGRVLFEMGGVDESVVKLAHRPRHSRVQLAGIQQFDRHTLLIGSLDARLQHSGMMEYRPYLNAIGLKPRLQAER